jgi:aryl-alcohol dehydrogenase-like predicted oxidoreductase
METTTAMAQARDVALITYSPLHSGILAGAVERDVPPPTYPTDFYRRLERRAEMSE